MPNFTDYGETARSAQPHRLPRDSIPTDCRETPWSAQFQQTTARLPGVPNPTDYRETPWSAQSQQTCVRLPGVPNPNLGRVFHALNGL